MEELIKNINGQWKLTKNIKRVSGGWATVHGHAQKPGSKTDKPKGSIIHKFKTKKEAIAQHLAIMYSEKEQARKSEDEKLDDLKKALELISDLKETIKELKKRDFTYETEGPAYMHGFISPEGTYHEMHPESDHEDWIKNKTDLAHEDALGQGWIAVGQGGMHNASLHPDTLANPSGPAMSTLRRMVGSKPVGSNALQLNVMKPIGPDNFVDFKTHHVSNDHFGKYGTIPKGIAKLKDTFK